MIYRFSNFSLDPEAFELARGTEKVAVEPQAFNLLQFLIESRDRVVSKDELIEKVWDGRIVSDAALNSCVNAARRAVGDDGKSQAVIKTFPRRGFRFVGNLLDEPETDARTVPPSARAHADKPSIAVLPFENLSPEPEQSFFSDAIAEDIIMGLTRFRWFNVISRNSSFAYKGQSSDVRQIAHELGAQYVLEGSLRKSGNRVRIGCQLVDGKSGTQIWTDRYDRELEDIFDVQDEITGTVVGAVGPELQNMERERALGTQVGSIDAWTVYHQGMAILWDRQLHGEPQKLAEAIDRLTTATKIDPKFSRAYSGLAISYYIRAVLGSSESWHDDQYAGLAAAKEAVALDIEDAYAHCALGAMRLLAGEPRLAVPILETALELNPKELSAYLYLGPALTELGRGAEAFELMQPALGLARRDPIRGPLMVRMAEAKFQLGEYEQSVEWAQNSLRQPETQIYGHAALIAGLSKSGREEEAKQAVVELLSRRPDFTCDFIGSRWPIHDDDFGNRYREALLVAGIPKK
jgi:TolB-like protein/Flp pilus assembly protein TadD